MIIRNSLPKQRPERSRQFIRVHRNALVAVVYIEAVEKAANGRFHAKLQGVAGPVEVGRRHLSSLRAVLKQGLEGQQ